MLGGVETAVIFRPKAHFLVHRIGKHLVSRILEKHRHVQSWPGPMTTLITHLARSWLKQTSRHLSQRRFARAVVPHQSNKITRINGQIHLMNHIFAMVASAYLVQRQQRRGFRRYGLVGLDEVSPGSHCFFCRTAQPQLAATLSLRQQFLRCAVGHNPTRFQQKHPIHLRQHGRKTMLNQHNGDAQRRLQVAQDGQNLARVGHIQRSRRLIQNQDIGPHGQHRRNSHTLLLPAGKLGGIPLLEVGNAHCVKRPIGPRLHLCFGQPQIARTKSDLVGHA